MKTTKIIAIAFILSIFFTVLNSCKKYPNGPTLSLMTKKARVCGTWKIEKYIVNDVDETTYFNSIAPDYQIEIKKDGNYISTANNITIEQGTWKFLSNKEYLKTTITSTGISTENEILRLSNKECWIKNKTNNQILELHLKEK